MRIVVKGGVWKNTEDEILKAAISKYGKNQWARISSLLVRKTPKQCKARWTEWLDPAIKKTEWSKEEDEKLLHLAKLMPTQWRTIAPIVGRTANQCLERYQKLLDEAEMAENAELGLTGTGEPAATTADDVRRLRPGEIDPDPENRPAKPDPVDMDEDEKEMLSEARARLANTQGKKAKRKARERQLEEARRLAQLQKKRELKAAGILMRAKPNKKGMDYQADIPFNKQPAAGFYDTTDEDQRRVARPTGKSLRDVEGGRRKQDREEDKRKAQSKRQRESKDAQQNFAAAAAANEQHARESLEHSQISKRRKLDLPQAQVGDAELDEIVKIGHAGENARAMVADPDALQHNDASDGLLGSYEALTHARNARTPRTEQRPDNVMAEARNLRNMTVQQTPLLGEENTPRHELIGRGTGFEGATPRQSVAATPNPLATPRAALTDGGSEVGATPRSAVGATPLRTPLRDSLSINAELGAGETPRDVRSARDALRIGLKSLPKPKNDFELVLDDEDDEQDGGGDGGDDDEMAAAMRIEDASEREDRLKALRQAEQERMLARRSSAVKRGLPRPPNFDARAFLAALGERSLGNEDDMPSEGVDKEAELLVAREMVRLLEHDAVAHPVAGGSKPGAVTKMSYYDDELMARARSEVHDELARALELPGASDAVLRRTVALDAAAFMRLWQPTADSLAFDARSRSWVDSASLSDPDRIAGLSALLAQNRDKMTRDSAKAAKAEKKLAVTLGGYQKRADVLAGKLTDVTDEIARGQVELRAFERLAMNEQSAMIRRVEALRDEVDGLERREREGQARFRELNDMQALLAKSIEDLSMQEAELINEAAMAQAD